jgi:hypothetical protein
MAELTPKQSNDNPLSREEERELREALRQAYEADFPNPERHGCPDKGTLRTLAWRKTFPDAQEVVSHLSHCSPCSKELTELIRQYKSWKWVYRVAALVLIVVGIVAWASWRFMWNRGAHVPEPSSIVKTTPEPVHQAPGFVPPSAQEHKSTEGKVVLLDLRLRGVTRGVGTKQEEEDLNLSKGRLKLTIYLPIGSEEGDYEARITSRQNQAVTVKGQAGMKGYINVLTVEVDTSGFPPGKCSLAIRQAGWEWSTCPVRLK